MKLSDLDDERRVELGLGEDSMALHADHVGQYGEHAVAKNAGMVAGDIIVGFDGRDDRMTETDLLAYALQEKEPGDRVTITILRDGQRREIPLQLPQ